MSRSLSSPRRYQFSLRELVWFTVALMLAFSCLRHGWMNLAVMPGLPLVVGGLALAGGTVGAAVGRAFEDDRGGVTWLGAYLGSIGAVGILFLSPFIYLLFLVGRRAWGW